jgi:flavin reductase (DIM6/NTAB) family NADH-FMN oxidoreductase RutF
MHVAAASLDADETYRLLSSVVVPRPIAWITSLSPAGIVNLAPFSCFTFVSNRPPLIGVTIGRKVGRRKDTGANIHATREFVINIGDSAQMEQIHLSGTEHPPDVSEVDFLGLRTAPSIAIGCPVSAMHRSRWSAGCIVWSSSERWAPSSSSARS